MFCERGGATLSRSVHHAREFEGLGVTPCVYRTTHEVDLFAEEMEKVIAKWLPA